VLGSGLYAAVFDNPAEGGVIKITRGYDKYIHYLRIIHDLGGPEVSPFVPKISRVLQIKNKGETSWDKENPNYYDLFAVWMEKLKPCSKVRYSGEEIVSYEHYGDDPGMKRWVRKLDQLYGRHALYNDKVKLNPKHTDLFALLDLARERTTQHLNLDLHCGNVMMRGQQVVLTDPFS
jgi:hypothetical protein